MNEPLLTPAESASDATGEPMASGPHEPKDKPKFAPDTEKPVASPGFLGKAVETAVALSGKVAGLAGNLVTRGEPAAAIPAAAVALAPAPAAPPRPAAWMDNEASEDWCPAVLAPYVGSEIVQLHYEDALTRENAAPGGWRVLAATRRGRYHAHRGTHREDAVDFLSGDRFTVLCMSDGAGASKHSRVASELTVRTIKDHLRDWFAKGEDALMEAEEGAAGAAIGAAMVEAVQAAISRLQELSAAAASPLKDFFCTLLLTVHFVGPKADLLLFSQVGDGFFAALDRDGIARRYGKSDSGAYSGEVGCFVPEKVAIDRARHITVVDAKRLEAFLLCTDGIEDAFFPVEKHAVDLFRQFYTGVTQKLASFEVQPQHGPVLGASRGRERLARWLKFEKRGENDDRSVLIFYREPVRVPAEFKVFQPPASPPPANLPSPLATEAGATPANTDASSGAAAPGAVLSDSEAP